MVTAEARPRIVHEAEVQRQHPRFRIAAQCILEGAPHPVFDWSLGGVSVLGVETAYAVGDLVDLRIVHTVDQVALVIEAVGEVRYQLEADGRVGFRFVEPTEKQLAVMRRVFEAYVEGELVPLEGVIDGVETGSNQAAEVMGTGVTLMRVLALGALASLGLAIAYTVSSNLYARNFVHEAASAVIEAESITLGAPAPGQVDFLVTGSVVEDGQPVASLKARDGASVTIDSPCRCRIGARPIADGSFAMRGDPLIRLIRPEGGVRLRATLPREALADLDRAHVRIRYADGRSIVSPAIALRPMVLEEETPTRGRQLYAVVTFDPGRDDLRPEDDQRPVWLAIDASPVASAALTVGFGL
jgi:alginate biosynthesis protein Alg44